MKIPKLNASNARNLGNPGNASRGGMVLVLLCLTSLLLAQRGYYDAPYTRYEADEALLGQGAVVLPRSHAQSDLQSEASGQVCVELSGDSAHIEFAFSEAADGLVIRYSVPDGDSALLGLYSGEERIDSLLLTSNWSWEYLWMNGDPNNEGIVNEHPRMRFDEVRYHLPQAVSSLTLVNEWGHPTIDFVEMEPVPQALQAPEGAVTFEGEGTDLQAFIDANGGKAIYIPEGVYHIDRQIYLGVANTSLHGAGMWHSQLNFTVTDESNGGLRANAEDISYSDLYLTTDMTTRTGGYAGIHGVYTSGSRIQNMWVEHFATGAWIAQYVNFGPEYADGFVMSHCRFRNTYADGINLVKGTRNAVVEHCNFRNNGDDAMAIWSAEGLECINNTYRHNTAENGFRAAGAALYGGKDNRFHDLIIRDMVDVGITVTNTFSGVGFNDEGMHEFFDITISSCGTFNAIYNDRVGAINMYHASSAGTRVQNIRFYNMDILDSRCDAIRLARQSGLGFSNLVFENLNIDGTGLEYPENNVNELPDERGFAVVFDNNPRGEASHCQLNYANLGGNANGVAFSSDGMGNFEWLETGPCEIVPLSGVSLLPADTSIEGGQSLKLIPAFTPENATNTIVHFASSDPEVATVQYDGLVTGLSMGEATIAVWTMDGEFTASSRVVVSSDPLLHYRIKNRWQNTYLLDGGDFVKYSATSGSALALWKLDEKEGSMAITNVSTGEPMHIEDLQGKVQCSTPAAPGGLSEWVLEEVGDGFVRIRSAQNEMDYMHVENLNGHAEYGNIEESWWSAMWMLEPVFAVSGMPTKVIGEARIYPNPSRGDLSISSELFQTGEALLVSIVNAAGQLVYANSHRAGQSAEGSVEVRTGEQLKAGSYTVIVAGSSGIVSGSLVISR